MSFILEANKNSINQKLNDTQESFTGCFDKIISLIFSPFKHMKRYLEKKK